MKSVKEKIVVTIEGSELDALLAFGPDNFSYLTGCVLPFAEHYPERKAAAILPLEGKPAVVLPYDWSEAVEDQEWSGDILVYDENQGSKTQPVVSAIAERMGSTGLDSGRIGIDAHRATKSLTAELSAALPDARWEHTDAALRGLRIVKEPWEVDLIETASKQADRGIIYALMHLEGTIGTLEYTLAEFTERIRVHINENGASGVGILATSLGPDATRYYSPQRGWFRNGEIFRMDVSSHYKGRWTNVGRMGVTDRPTPEQEAAYVDNRRLKEAALETLKPGKACNEVYAHVVKSAEKEGVSLWKGVGVGHGVGASHHEPPYLNAADATKLKPGMVVALDVHTHGPGMELIHDKDVYAITDDGSRKLSWYRDWDRMYAVTGFRATH